jgi:uncharacterized membrane protein YfcA
MARYAARGIASAPLTSALVIGTLPGVVIGAVIRIELLAGPDAFYLVIAAVLAPLGAWLALGPSPAERTPPMPSDRRITALALLVGTIGGIYGIGGGSLLGPILVGLGFSVAEVAPAALASTFLTSVVGVIAYAVLGLRTSGSIAPDWAVGVGIGVGGLLGGYLGASLQPHFSERVLRRGLGLLALALGLRYLLLAFT